MSDAGAGLVAQIRGSPEPERGGVLLSRDQIPAVGAEGGAVHVTRVRELRQASAAYGIPDCELSAGGGGEGCGSGVGNDQIYVIGGFEGETADGISHPCRFSLSGNA